MEKNTELRDIWRVREAAEELRLTAEGQEHLEAAAILQLGDGFPPVWLLEKAQTLQFGFRPFGSCFFHI
jgi:hypothetical protein